MIYAIVIVAAIGHASICIWLINRFHGLVVSRAVLKFCDALWYLFAVGMPFAVGSSLLRSTMLQQPPQGIERLVVFVYLSLAILATIVAAIHRVRFVLRSESPEQLVANHTEVIQLTKRLGHRPVLNPLTSALSRIPGNEILELSVHDKQISIDSLPTALEGLSITHLSDLHIMGQMSKSFYQEIVHQSNDLKSDLVFITGDIVEKANYLSWLPEIFGGLNPPLGTYFVLGNHERRIHDEPRIRATLRDANMVDVGGKCRWLEAGDKKVLLAGTEVPWFQPSPDVSGFEAQQSQKCDFKILLSHSPDQLPFARRHGFQLMLAGHTHGGQVRLPGFGPVLAPSINGIRHASGTFYCQPTLLHVSRGLSGTRPLRWNCRPELTRLVLTSPNSGTPDR